MASEGSAGSVNDFLATAGVTKGAMYFHFSSKAELVHAVIDDAAERTDFVLVHLAAHHGSDPLDAVEVLVRDYHEQWSNSPVLRADAVLWTDPDFGSYARAGLFACVRGAVVRHLVDAGIGDAGDVADTVMAVLTAHVTVPRGGDVLDVSPQLVLRHTAIVLRGPRQSVDGLFR